MKKIISKRLAAPLSALLLAAFVLAPVAEARERNGGGGGGGNRQAAQNRGGNGGDRNVKVNNSRTDVRSTNVRNTSVNNVNVNKNVNVNVDNNNRHGGWDNNYHPVATAAAVTAAVVVTSAVVGSMVRTVPSNCVPVNYGGMVYQQCGSTWYQPQYSGPQVQYIVINPPY